MKAVELYRDLAGHLSALPPEPSVLELLQLLQKWLNARLPQFDRNAKDYRLDWFAAIDLGQFPVGRSTLPAGDTVRRLLDVPSTTWDQLAMFIMDTFWQGITLESGVTCPRCDALELRILHDASLGQLVFECEQCGWAQMPNGDPWRGSPPLEPATNDQLEAAVPPRTGTN